MKFSTIWNICWNSEICYIATTIVFFYDSFICNILEVSYLDREHHILLLIKLSWLMEAIFMHL